MWAGLLPLFPKTIDFRGRSFRLLKDRHLFDTQSVATTDGNKPFFVTIGTNKKSQSIFVGDFTLVKEANVFLAVQLQALIRDRVLSTTERNTFYKFGWFQWNVTVPETVTVDEDRLQHISPGPDLRIFTTATAETANDGAWQYENRRTYLQGANKVVPGGRAIEFNVNWQETQGNGLTTTTGLSIVYAGGEYEPGGAAKKPAAPAA